MTQRNKYRVTRWSWPKEKGGTDGVIPLDAMRMILAEAPRAGVEGLQADHFMAGANSLSRKDLSILSMLMDGSTAEAIAKANSTTVAEVLESEMRLRKSVLVSADVWERVARRRSPGYRKRRRLKK